MDQSKLLEMQLQMRHNNEDLHSFIKDMDSWESDIKKKDDDLKKKPSEPEEKTLPPVRNSLQRKKKKKKQKPEETKEGPKNPKRISGYDFKAWDKFDVDKAIEDIDGEGEKSSSEYETDEDWEIEREIQQGNVLKDEGNLYFKQKKYNEAIECYTKAIGFDPTNAILPANRAMALLKQNKFGAADIDCTTSITLDPTYVKAYSRRASARLGLGRLEDAERDFDKVLVLEPGNKHAKSEKEKLKKKLNSTSEDSSTMEAVNIDSDTGIVKAVYKPPSERSKKPLRRIKIQEVGLDDGQSIRQAIAKTESTQSEAKKKVTEKDSELFEHFVSEKAGESISEITDTKNESTEEGKSSSKDGIENLDLTSLEGDRNKSGEKEQSKEKLPGSKKSEAVSSPASSPRLPEVPTTSYQFQTDWKMVRKDAEKRFLYLKAIDPSKYATLFGQALDADILNLILSTLTEFYLPANMDVYPALYNLTNVKRFSMTAMFMSTKEKQVVHGLISALKERKQHNEEDISKLAKAYQL